MAYTYTPFDYQRATAPQYDSYEGGYLINNEYVPNLDKWNQQQANLGQGAFQGYAQDQFKGLFDMMNANPNPLSGFSQAPMYSPLDRGNYESDNAFQDARFGNINSYLGNLGTFLGNMGGGDANVAQAAVQRQIQQANMPQVGAMQNYSGVPSSGMPTAGVPAAGGSGGLGGFGNYGGWGGRQVSGGWGSHPVAEGLLGFGGE